MTYWDLHEPEPGKINLGPIIRQLEIIGSYGGVATVCIGMRQPRWPETHIPKWAMELEEPARIAAYLRFQSIVTQHIYTSPIIQSWQLENEFWNKSFGIGNTYSRHRLVSEFLQLRAEGGNRPIIMSLANTIGIPVFEPKADVYGVTIYLTQNVKGKYRDTVYPPRHYRFLRRLIKLLRRRELIVHELQAEPWGPKANWEMSDTEQSKSMNPEELRRAVAYARKTGIKYLDLWGAEWWYWRLITRDDKKLWAVVSELAQTNGFRQKPTINAKPPASPALKSLDNGR